MHFITHAFNADVLHVPPEQQELDVNELQDQAEFKISKISATDCVLSTWSGLVMSISGADALLWPKVLYIL